MSPSPDELLALSRKYDTLAKLRRARSRGGAVADRATLRALAREFPGALRELDPRAKPVPMLMPGATDGRFFARLGIQTYGFLPMPLPAELHFMRLIHAENERIPVEAIEFGTRAIARVLERF